MRRVPTNCIDNELEGAKMPNFWIAFMPVVWPCQLSLLELLSPCGSNWNALAARKAPFTSFFEGWKTQKLIAENICRKFVEVDISLMRGTLIAEFYFEVDHLIRFAGPKSCIWLLEVPLQQQVTRLPTPVHVIVCSQVRSECKIYKDKAHAAICASSCLIVPGGLFSVRCGYKYICKSISSSLS